MPPFYPQSRAAGTAAVCVEPMETRPPSHIHANPSKNLTYANMERYINVYANAAELLEMLERVKELGAAQTNSVQFVKRWFISQFPNYKKLPDFTSSKLIVEVIPAPLINEDKAA